MEDLPSIDEMARRLTELGAFGPERWDEFKRLELSALSSARGEDALLLFSRLPQENPVKRVMQHGLDDLRFWARGRVGSAPASDPPLLVLVSGAPGSGKSAMVERVESTSPGILVCCADDFKAHFKCHTAPELAALPEPARADLGRSVYIHRLTALPSWEMVDEAIEKRRDLVVEMLGMGASEDERTIRRALAKGYRAEVRHVGCSVEHSLARAAKRHFDQKDAGGEGRWIGLAAAASKQRSILASFVQLYELLRGSSCVLSLHDNSEREMKCVWSSEEGCAPPIDRFASWRFDSELWRPGANPAADLCALARGPDGRWKVALVERGAEPHKGKWALPGGFVRGAGRAGSIAPFVWGAEQAGEAALRRFAEETLCTARPGAAAFVGKFDAMERDPRNGPTRWVESWVFRACFEEGVPLLGGDGTRQARWVDAEEAASGALNMAFDHAELIQASLAEIATPAHRGPKLG